MAIVNISRVEDAMDCEALYRHRWITGLRAFAEDTKNMQFGLWVHRALAVQAVKGDGAMMASAVEDQDCPEEMHGYGVVLLRAYADYWGPEQVKVLMVEKNLRVKLGENWLVGRPDMLVEDNGLWHRQHKTVGNSVGLIGYTRKFNLDMHEVGYWLLAQEAGYKLRGTELNLLRKVSLDETGKRKGKATDNPVFLRSKVIVTAEMVDEFKFTFARECEAIDRLEKGERPVQNWKACYGYNRVCYFQQLCLMGSGSKAEGVIGEEYFKRERDYVDEAREEATGAVSW